MSKANKNMELMALIHGRFKSEAAFADEIGWYRQKLNKVLSGEQRVTIEEVNQIADGLGVPFMLVANIFLRMMSTN